MTDDISIEHRPGLSWQLLAAFEGESAGDSGRQIADRIVNAVQKVGVQPQQLERIRASILEAVDRRRRGRSDLGRSLALRVQIWTWNVPIFEQGEDGTLATTRVRQEHCGWGFFLVEKQSGDREAAGVESFLLVDLFLYREQQSR